MAVLRSYTLLVRGVDGATAKTKSRGKGIILAVQDILRREKDGGRKIIVVCQKQSEERC